MFIPRITTASGGIEALELLRQHPELEAVLSDVMMPNMSGIELAEELARRHHRLPVVLMTGYSDKLQEGVDLGRPLVAKPFRAEEVLKALAQAKELIASQNVIQLGTSWKT